MLCFRKSFSGKHEIVVECETCTRGKARKKYLSWSCVSRSMCAMWLPKKKEKQMEKIAPVLQAMMDLPHSGKSELTVINHFLCIL